MLTVFQSFNPIATGILLSYEGAIYHDGFYFAARGYGAWRWNSRTLQGVRLHVSKTAKIVDGVLLTEGPPRFQ